MQGAAQLESVPRVNATQLPHYVGRNVRVVGKVVSVQGMTASLETGENAAVTVRLPQANMGFTSTFVEVIGVVQPDRSVLQRSYTPFGESFDLDSYSNMISAGSSRMHDVFVS